MRKRGSWPVIALLSLTLAGCSLSGKDGASPTPMPTVAPTSVATAAAGLDAAASQTITDGVCTAFVPDAWVDLGNGRGMSPSGARFTLFGNKLVGDNAWAAAGGVVATIAANGAGKLDQSADAVSFARADGSSYEARRRLSDRYCDLSMTSALTATPEERAIWPAIGATMASAPVSTP